MTLWSLRYANLMAEELAGGTTLVNWRGHGAVNSWGGVALRYRFDYAGGGPYQNYMLPAVNISMDCLDGHFTFPGWNSVSEQLLRQPDGYGVAAHWSSTGLGLLFDHSVLATSFYQGLFEQNQHTIGDAMNYSKTRYLSLGRDPVEAYSFLLQGDPAMALFRPDVALELTAEPARVGSDQPTTAVLTFNNLWLYPYKPIITATIPAGLNYVSYQSNRAVTFSQTTLPSGARELRFALNQVISEGQELRIELNLHTTTLGNYTITAQSSGEEINLTPNQLARSVVVQVEPLQAEFTSSSPDTVGQPTRFTNQSIGALSYEWDFGDNLGTSTEVNPTYTYNTPGVYNVTLVALDANIAATVTHQVEIVPVGVLTPIANFSHTAPNTKGVPTQFTNLTEDGVTYEWDFGDGATSTEAHPTYTYQNAGTYEVRLTAFNGSNSHSVTQQLTITEPIANFSSNAPHPLGTTTRFTNLSTNATSYLWNFGDGSDSSTALTPVYNYNEAGSYIVSLTAMADGVSDTFTRTIVINQQPTANFTVEPNPTYVGEVTTFTNSSLNALTYVWDFGDESGSSTAVSPTHIYTSAGVYTVTLTAENGGLTHVRTEAVLVLTPENQPTAGFTVNPILTTVGAQTFFTNQSQNALTYLWDFGDGGSSTAVNPVYSFPTAGTFTVTLTAENTGLEDSATAVVTVNPVGQINPTPAFSVPNPPLFAGVTIPFTNLSTNATSYRWEFDDNGASSTDINPSHTFAQPGTYLVTLTATNGGRTQTIGQNIIITPILGDEKIYLPLIVR
jgi:PKD repeat protein